MFRMMLTLALTVLVPRSEPLRAWQSASGSSRTISAQPSKIAGHQVLRVLTPETSGLCSNLPHTLLEDKEGRFWLGGASDPVVQMYDERVGRWEGFGQPTHAYEDLRFHTGAVLPYQVYFICQSADGKMWFSDQLASPRSASLSFLTFFDGTTWAAGSLPHPDRIRDTGLFAGTDGRVWSWVDETLRTYDRGGWSAPLSISGLFARARLDRRRWGSSDVPQALSTITINADTPLIRAAPGDPPSDSKAANTYVANDREDDSCEILAAIQDRQENIWLSDRQGLLRLDPRSGELSRIELPNLWTTEVIREDHRGRIWFGDRGGAYAYDKEKRSSTWYAFKDHVPLSSNSPVRAICEDRNGRMFFATRGGLATYSEDDGRWDLSDLRDYGLASSEACCVIQDTRGRIWVVGINGVLVLDR